MKPLNWLIVCIACTLALPLSTLGIFPSDYGSCPSLAHYHEITTDLEGRINVALAQVDDSIRSLPQKMGTVGISAAVAFGSTDLLWSAGYGYADLASKKTINAYTIFRIGSISKVFSALGMYRARDDGMLSIDDEVAKYAPNFHLNNPFTAKGKRGITFHQLATHMAGMPREFPCSGPCSMTNNQAFNLINNLTLILPPNTMPVYSNLGFSVLGNVLAQVYGKSFNDYVQQVFNGYGLSSDTGVDIRQAPRSKLATPYNPDGSTCSASDCLSDFGWNDPCGSFYSNAWDLSRLLMSLFDEGPEGGNHFLDGTTIRESFLPRYMFTDKQSGFATPWELYYLGDYLLVTKRGDVDGYSSEIIMVPEMKLGITVLTNVVEHSYPYAQAMSEILVPAFDSVLKALSTLPVIPTNWKDYVGNYTAGGIGSVMITGTTVQPFGESYLTIYSDIGFRATLEWVYDEGSLHHFRMLPPQGALNSCFLRVVDELYQYVDFAQTKGSITSLTFPGLMYGTIFKR